MGYLYHVPSVVLLHMVTNDLQVNLTSKKALNTTNGQGRKFSKTSFLGKGRRSVSNSFEEYVVYIYIKRYCTYNYKYYLKIWAN